MMMEAVLDSIYEITSLVDSRISRERMKESWSDLTETIFHPIYEQHPRNPTVFVQLVHRYLRTQRAIGFRDDSWNLFLALEDTWTECNCLCATMFILLACFQVGFFPSAVWGAATVSHIFILNPLTEQGFETTRLCETKWFDLETLYRANKLVFPYDQFYSIVSIDSLVSVYAAGVLLAERYALSSRERRILLNFYPLLSFPTYRYFLFRDLYPEFMNTPIVLTAAEEFLEMVQTQQLIVAFANIVGAMFNLLQVYQILNPSYALELQSLAQQILHLLQMAQEYHFEKIISFSNLEKIQEDWTQIQTQTNAVEIATRHMERFYMRKSSATHHRAHLPTIPPSPAWTTI